MRISTIPYNLQSSNFDHVNKHYQAMNYTQVNRFKYPDSTSYTSNDNYTYDSDNRGGVSQTNVDGNIYSQEMGAGLYFTRQGTYQAYGVTRIGPELDGDNQYKLKDVTIKNEGLTGTWLGDVVGLMYKFSTNGSYNRDNCGLIDKIGICYLNPFDRKIITYTANKLIAGLSWTSRPDDSSKTYESAVMLDTKSKNDVYARKLKYVGIIVRHYYKHATGNHTLTGRIWNLRPIIVHDTRDWNIVKDNFTLNGNASGRKIIVPHNSTTWSEYNSGSYQIKTY